MVEPLDLTIGIKHGDDCTCTPLDPITVTTQPVVVNRDCPGQRELPRGRDEITGSVVIIWPHPSGLNLNVWDVQIQDAETGEILTTVLGLRLILGGSHGWRPAAVEVELTQLADGDGKPLGSGAPVVPDDDGKRFRTGAFRYVVAEMRIAEPPATRRVPRTAQYPVGGLGPAPTPFDTEARTIAEAQSARDGS